ncbi:hypothetical protein F511_46949 [Dorcoceras hygrometricum]|uniref:Secreted protein n=1 Tax=Dorcoceras hygrometricum TaxID=472368 RepID=A0A2Z6ZSB0_9LAMI|nr:hypothetical protein F511_46949 [Dorcoceras hygrometricum]
MTAHDAWLMSAGLAIMVARWSRGTHCCAPRLARLCAMHRAAMHVRRATWLRDPSRLARPTCGLVPHAAMAATAAVRRVSLQRCDG